VAKILLCHWSRTRRKKMILPAIGLESREKVAKILLCHWSGTKITEKTLVCYWLKTSEENEDDSALLLVNYRIKRESGEDSDLLLVKDEGNEDIALPF
jgi:hypothetical protein